MLNAARRNVREPRKGLLVTDTYLPGAHAGRTRPNAMRNCLHVVVNAYNHTIRAGQYSKAYNHGKGITGYGSAGIEQKAARAASLEVCLDPDAAYTLSMPGGIPLATCTPPDGACASLSASRGTSGARRRASRDQRRAPTRDARRGAGREVWRGASKVRALAVTSRYTPLLGKTFDVLVHAKPQCA